MLMYLFQDCWRIGSLVLSSDSWINDSKAVVITNACIKIVYHIKTLELWTYLNGHLGVRISFSSKVSTNVIKELKAFIRTGSITNIIIQYISSI